MTRDEAMQGMMRLQASYPNMQKLDATTVVAYVSEIGMLNWEDFSAACSAVVRTLKFFPSIAELLEAADLAARKRLEAQEHEEREERLALQAGQDAIMDPNQTATGPNHQRFMDMLKGKVKPPSMMWKKTPPSERDGKYKPIPQAEREARVAVLREQAAVLLSGDQA